MLPADVLRARHRARVTMGAAVLWTGYVRDAVIRRVPPTVTLRLEGLSERAGRLIANVSQPDSVTAVANSAAVVGLAAALYAPLPLTSNGAAVPVSAYAFEGPASRYLSDFSQVAGVFPFERHDGALALRDPVPPAAQPAVDLDSATTLIAAYAGTNASEQLRNVITIETPNYTSADGPIHGLQAI